MVWLIIIGMTAIIFASRYVLLEPRLPVRLGPRVRQLLSFSTVSVLPALTAPMIFVRDEQLTLELFNPYLLGAILAAVLMLVTKHTLFSVIVSMLAFVLMRTVFGL